MENFIKKVIRASAGTGKTYRLSLEYIGLLLKFSHLKIHFSEILVITFTKKATAEIRERIFQQLDAIIQQNDAGRQLCTHLHSIPGVSVGDQQINYLKSVYHEMLMNKNLVQISTIDSFTNTVFRTIIAPYLGLTTYDIDNTIDKELLARLYQHLLENADTMKKLKAFFLRSGRKKIEEYENLLLSMLNNRYIFHFIDAFPPQPPDAGSIAANAAECLEKFRQTFYQLLARFQAYLDMHQSHRSSTEVLKKEFRHALAGEIATPEIAQIFTGKLQDPNFLDDNQKLFFRHENFWNGSYIFRKKDEKGLAAELSQEMKTAVEFLADYFFYQELLTEQQDIREIARLILNRYDDIKFRDKIFTFGDISYYTYKYLYDPELSLIDTDYVTNAFYEYLSGIIRFILIDEFQDTSIIQFKTLLPIIKEVTSGAGVKDYGGAIVVGDEKQSIYGWRGGERDLLLKMPAILNGADQVTLDTCYRSDPNIIDFINAIFSHSFLHTMLEKQGIAWAYDPANAFKKTSAGCIQVTFRNYANTDNDPNTISREEDALREFLEQILTPLIRNRQISVRNTAILARRNKDLQYIASILDEFEIDYILESSNSVLNHRAIKPLRYLFHFLVYQDVHDLLKFLRSDWVLIEPADLKTILLAWRDQDDTRDLTGFLSGLNHIPAVKKVGRLIEPGYETDRIETIRNPRKSIDLLNFTRQILEEYNVTGIFNLENDIKNINLFLEIVAGFENSNRDFPQNLKGFLDYCAKNENNEIFQQSGLEDVNAINLMTIHKSKGLEFDNVFLYQNLSGKPAQSSGTLSGYLDYEPDYHQITDYVLTYNYDHILPFCHKKSLKRGMDIRDAIEELNNFYVAVTRAKTNLFIYFAYRKAGGLEKFMTEIGNSDTPAIDSIVASTIYQLFKTKALLNEVNSNLANGVTARLQPQPEKTTPEIPTDFSFIRDYLDTERRHYLQKDPVRLLMEEHLDFKAMYVEKKNVDRGNIAHYYLSHIHHGTDRERQVASTRTICYYGSLLPVPEIRNLIAKVNQFIDQNPTLFSEFKWQQVFTEYPVFSETGRELRLDRLMIDEKNKEIMIIDFKTGETYEESQMQHYLDAVKSLPVVTKEKYRVSGHFIELAIS